LANLSSNLNSLGLSGLGIGLGNVGTPSLSVDNGSLLLQANGNNSIDQLTLNAQKDLITLTNLYKTQLCKHFE